MAVTAFSVVAIVVAISGASDIGFAVAMRLRCVPKIVSFVMLGL